MTNNLGKKLIEECIILSRKYGYERIILLLSQSDTKGEWGGVSYGIDKKTCSDTAKVLDKILDETLLKEGKSWDINDRNNK